MNEGRPGGFRQFHLDQVMADGAATFVARQLAEEEPIALEYDGLGYAVLMATPADLLDLARGFSLTERLIDRADQILDIDCYSTMAGTIIRIALADEVRPRIWERVRHRTSDSSCGLCGIENLEQALRPLPRVTARTGADDTAVFRAAAAIHNHQPLNAETGAVHAAAWCSADGAINIVREDVGRHNAFDKLIGAMAHGHHGWSDGFALLSSRCSFELVEKAVLSGCPMLATISAPTALAVTSAAEAGLDLRVLVRSDSLLTPPR